LAAAYCALHGCSGGGGCIRQGRLDMAVCICGEIAVRVIRACAEMGVRSVAIYSEADRHSLHVKKADEAYSLGADPLAGYLNVHHIVNLAVSTGCDRP